MKLLLILLPLLLTFSCSKEEKVTVLDQKIGAYKKEVVPLGDKKDLKGIKWETNDSDPVFASNKAKKGGRLNSTIGSFPLTVRYVGPDSNGSFRSFLDANRMRLIGIHPITNNFYPSLATHWSVGKNHQSIFYKLDKDAKWSDGTPVTADDYVFVLEFMRSKHIVAPWYNNYYVEFYEKIVKYDDYTIGIFTKKKHSDYEMKLMHGNEFEPQPKHFFKPGLNKDWVKNYQWKIAPNTGAYFISEIKKGKAVKFKRKKSWWAKDRKYYKNRFNIDKVKIKVERESSVAYQKFLKGDIDMYGLTIPEYWHVKSNIKTVKPFAKGYIKKLWFYNDVPRSNAGIFLNQDFDLFKDVNIRKAFGHAMNIDKVIKTVLRGDYERQHTSQVGRGKYTNEKIRAREFSLKKVDMYMKKAGWDKRGDDGIRVKNGRRMEVILTTGYKHHKDRIVVIKEEAKKAGIDIQINIMDSATSFKSMLEKQHQVAWMAWGGGILPAYWQFYHSKNAHKKQNNNFTNTDNPEMDKIIMEYRDEFNDKKKQALSRKIQQLEYDLGAYIPTFLVPYIRIGYWRWIKMPKIPGVNDSEGTILAPFWMGRFWIDEDVKKETLKAIKEGKTFPPEEIIDTTYKKS